jgi:leucyl-tRNA synthetase
LFFNENGTLSVSADSPSVAELKILNRTIHKIKNDIERFSFNTGVSNFMICVNELSEIKSNNKEVLEKLLIALASFAPHIAEELWEILGHEKSIAYESFPEVDKQYLEEDSVEYPVSFNGKMRFKLELPAGLDAKSIEESVLSNEKAQKWLEDKTIVKVIVVPGKIVNIVIR